MAKALPTEPEGPRRLSRSARGFRSLPEEADTGQFQYESPGAFFSTDLSPNFFRLDQEGEPSAAQQSLRPGLPDIFSGQPTGVFVRTDVEQPRATNLADFRREMTAREGETTLRTKPPGVGSPGEIEAIAPPRAEFADVGSATGGLVRNTLRRFGLGSDFYTVTPGGTRVPIRLAAPEGDIDTGGTRNIRDLLEDEEGTLNPDRRSLEGDESPTELSLETRLEGLDPEQRQVVRETLGPLEDVGELRYVRFERATTESLDELGVKAPESAKMGEDDIVRNVVTSEGRNYLQINPDQFTPENLRSLARENYIAADPDNALRHALVHEVGEARLKRRMPDDWDRNVGFDRDALPLETRQAMVSDLSKYSLATRNDAFAEYYAARMQGYDVGDAEDAVRDVVDRDIEITNLLDEIEQTADDAGDIFSPRQTEGRGAPSVSVGDTSGRLLGQPRIRRIDLDEISRRAQRTPRDRPIVSPYTATDTETERVTTREPVERVAPSDPTEYVAPSEPVSQSLSEPVSEPTTSGVSEPSVPSQPSESTPSIPSEPGVSIPSQPSQPGPPSPPYSPPTSVPTGTGLGFGTSVSSPVLGPEQATPTTPRYDFPDDDTGRDEFPVFGGARQGIFTEFLDPIGGERLATTEVDFPARPDQPVLIDYVVEREA